MRRRVAVLCCVVVSLFLTTACGLSAAPEVSSIPEGIAIDPVFREYYNYLGGQDRLGVAIAPSAQEAGITTQYIETGKLVFDPAAAPVRRFRLDALGVQMGVSEPPVPPPSHPELRYANGHVIFPDFYPVYEELGAETVGMPLTEVRFNLIRKRYEQFFENLGLYRLEGSAEVRLLSYGVWACQECGAKPTITSATIDVHGNNAIDPAFRSFVDEQGTNLTGFVLQSAAPASDGKYEQILENVVLVSDSQPGQTPVSLRPLSQALNITADPPKPYSGDPNMFFFPTQGAELGYEIPIFFWEYIGQHGGMGIFGQPITHYALLSGVIYHQCFQNLCLMYDQGVNEQARIRPEPFGYAYKLLYGQVVATSLPTPTTPILGLPPAAAPETRLTELPPAQVVPGEPAAPTQEPAPTVGGAPVEPTALPFVPFETPTPLPPAPANPMREITMQVWGRYNVVSSQQAQEISVWITENDLPSPGATVDLTVKLPDGSEQTFRMPPTGPNGQSSLVLPAISGPDSTLIPYRACMMASADTRMCIADFFMIWNNP